MKHWNNAAPWERRPNIVTDTADTNDDTADTNDDTEQSGMDEDAVA